MILTRKILNRFSLQSGKVFLWDKDTKPRQINLPESALKVSVGPKHNVIVSETGKLYTFGDNSDGQCGHGHKDNIDSPKLVEYFENNNIKVKDAVCGERHTLVLDTNGQVYSFGFGGKDRGIVLNLFMNPVGPLGHGNHATCIKPVKIKALEGKIIQRITVGREFSTVIDTQGNVFNFGNGEYGAFGDGKNKNYDFPVLNEYFQYLKTQQKVTVKKIKSSEKYSIALFSDNHLYGWGSNEFGQIGVKSEIGIEMYQTVNFPTEVIKEGYQNQQVVNFDISDNILLFQLDNGQLWWTGMKMTYTPQRVQLDVKPKLFAAGSRCFAVVDDNNNIFTYHDYIKGDFEENLLTGIKKASGQAVFGGEIVGIGGEYDTRYAIVK